jgi:hypothetical protein
MTTDQLSPAAQAVMKAAAASYWDEEYEVASPAVIAAAALRAAANQVVPEADTVDAEEWLGQSSWQQAEQSVRFRIFAIAAELEQAAHNTTEAQ